jgi:hypothetical protein
MRVAQVARMFTLCFLLATTGWIYAQDQRDETKPAEEKRPEATKPAENDTKAPRADEAKPQEQNDTNRNDKAVQQDDKTRQQNDAARQQDDRTRQDQTQQPSDARQNNVRPNDARPAAQGNSAGQGGGNMQAAGGQRGGHIPDDKFRGSFGREHHFAIHQATTVQGQPGFTYGGYSFILPDGWPAGWAYTDDCYVDYIDGEYFLFDLLHPGVRVALIVVM